VQSQVELFGPSVRRTGRSHLALQAGEQIEESRFIFEPALRTRHPRGAQRLPEQGEIRLHRSDTLRIRDELRPQKQRWAESAQHENEDRQESAMGSHEGRVFSL
jgi:hypothetical protein